MIPIFINPFHSLQNEIVPDLMHWIRQPNRYDAMITGISPTGLRSIGVPDASDPCLISFAMAT
jgi:hypothetical protein